MTVLKVSNLTVSFSGNTVVRDVNFELNQKETLAIVGESGCGKSVTSKAIMDLLPGNALITGSVNFDGRDLRRLTRSQMNTIRGNEIAMIMQEPIASLNPVLRIGHQIKDILISHRNISNLEAHKMAIELLKKVNIPEAEKRFYQYPHQFSGGMCQRVMIAMALSNNPKILIADEPTTALDVTVQAQVISLMKNLQSEEGLSILFITHDLGLVAEIADNVLVMYAGQVVEYGTVYDIYENPLHPYTIGLFSSLPNKTKDEGLLDAIPGDVIDASKVGCSFAPRCREAMDICKTTGPSIFSLEGRQVRCWKVEDKAKNNLILSR